MPQASFFLRRCDYCGAARRGRRLAGFLVGGGESARSIPQPRSTKPADARAPSEVESYPRGRLLLGRPRRSSACRRRHQRRLWLCRRRRRHRALRNRQQQHHWTRGIGARHVSRPAPHQRWSHPDRSIFLLPMIRLSSTARDRDVETEYRSAIFPDQSRAGAHLPEADRSSEPSVRIET